MKGQYVVKRYAKALFSAAESASRLSELKEDIEALDTLFSQIPGLKRYCLNPASPEDHESRKTFIRTAFLPYLSNLSARTVELLEKNNRLEALPWLSKQLGELFDARNGIINIRIESANVIDADLKGEIVKRLEKRLDRRIRTTWDARPELIGGMRFLWQNNMLDLSVRGRLSALCENLKRNGK